MARVTSGANANAARGPLIDHEALRLSTPPAWSPSGKGAPFMFSG
ncbi:hypothetical protein [Candidatus Poriferisocius sp.]